MRQKKVLIVAPHMDDEVLGCGGAIARHVKEGDVVFVCFIAHRIYNHKFDKKKNDLQKEHSLRAKRSLGYREAVFFDLSDEKLDTCIQKIIIPLENYVLKVKPDIVYCPFQEDNNQDHRAVFQAARVALRPAVTAFIKQINMYEVPSSTEQSPPLLKNAFLPNYYIDIRKYINKKIAAFRCYEIEKRNYPHPRSEMALKILAQKRGIEIGFEFAEAFMKIRDKWG